MFALVRTYPETTPRGSPARSRYAHGSMNDGSDCRSIHSLVTFLCFTGRFLSLQLLLTVSVNDAIGNFISGPGFLVADQRTGRAGMLAQARMSNGARSSQRADSTVSASASR